MASIEAVGAREILDSRGNPTVEVEVALDDGTIARAAVPSGASTGAFEAVERRDGDKARYLGKGVEDAVNAVIDEIAPELIGFEATEQRLVDQALIDLDGTPNKGKLGANAILGVSLAVAKAAADSADLPLFRYVGGPNAHVLPVPMMNILNGGSHADSNVDIQEFMVAPIGADHVPRGAAHRRRGLPLAEVRAEEQGPVAPASATRAASPRTCGSNRDALDLILVAIEKAGFTPGNDVGPRARRRRDRVLQGRRLPVRGQGHDARRDDRVLRAARRGLPAGLHRGPAVRGRVGRLVRSSSPRVGDKVQIVGDDLFVTNPSACAKGIELKAANSLLVKLNQIGTLTETLDAVDAGAAHRLHRR